MDVSIYSSRALNEKHTNLALPYLILSCLILSRLTIFSCLTVRPYHMLSIDLSP